MKDEPLISEAFVIVKAAYEIADEIEKNDADERWRTVSKIKNAANDVYFYTSQVAGAGAGAGQSVEFDCLYARKNLKALKAMLIFASKQDYYKLDPSVIVGINKLVKSIDLAMEQSLVETKRKIAEDLEPWLEKYKIWQKISKE